MRRGLWACTCNSSGAVESRTVVHTRKTTNKTGTARACSPEGVHMHVGGRGKSLHASEHVHKVASVRNYMRAYSLVLHIATALLRHTTVEH